MNLTQITDGIHYVGVNDRTTERFEGLWPLPLGVSYNSYIVLGNEKTALIDGGREGFLPEYLDRIESITGKEGIDYLVVNHMEPDHSGLIPALQQRYPAMKIIGNKQTIGMIGGFYKITNPEAFHQVADGDVVDLGGLTLRFVLTPMVHWPETMMTYCPERRVIFSGDAFGCFGALCGAVIDKDMDTSAFFPEMYRYYSNIVGKYGAFVQKALAKTRDLDIEYICTTHGPVWHNEAAKVVGIYDELSRYQGEDGVTVIYGSMYGNTERLAEMIISELAARGIRNIHVHNASKSDLSYMISDAFRYRGLIVGCPTYSMTIFPPVNALLTALQTREVKNKVTAAFGSYTWAPMATKKITEFMEAIKLPSAAGIAMQQAPGASTPDDVKAFVDAFLCAYLDK